MPAISISRLVLAKSITVEQEYEFESYTGSDRIKSRFFPDLELTVEQVIAFGKGI